jgi:hypothetical protein
MRKPIALLVLAAALSSAEGASTKLTDVWKAPDAPAKFAFKKILAACVTGDEAMRRTAEDYLVLRIGPDRTTPSYRVLPGNQTKDVEQAKAKVREAGFDGAIIIRVVSVDQEDTYAPPAAATGTVSVSVGYGGGYYGSYWGYWGTAWPMVYDPGYIKSDRVVRVETLVYSVTDDKILWGARTATTNPKSVLRAVDGIADAVAKRLKKDGLID